MRSQMPYEQVGNELVIESSGMTTSEVNDILKLAAEYIGADVSYDSQAVSNVFLCLLYVAGGNANRRGLIFHAVVTNSADLFPGCGLQKQGVVAACQNFSNVHRIYLLVYIFSSLLYHFYSKIAIPLPKKAMQNSTFGATEGDLLRSPSGLLFGLKSFGKIIHRKRPSYLHR